MKNEFAVDGLRPAMSAGALRCLSGLLALCMAAAAAAAPADLPPEPAVLQALNKHPLVRAAEATARAAQAEHDRLRSGSHEFGLRLGSARRSVNGGPDFNEWEAGLERGLRLPGKARLDDAIGERGVQEAQERVGDARHEAGRQLLALWYGWRQAEAEARLWREQATLLAEQRRIVELRVKRGDAARLDYLQVDAVWAQADSAARLAEARRDQASAELKARFPELPVPDVGTAEPAMPAGGEAEWVERTLEHNHELIALQLAGEGLQLQARRAEADNLPDPTVGLRYSSERDGEEKVLGISLSMPIPGGARRAQARVWQGQAEAMAEQVAAQRRSLAAQAAGNWQRAAAGVQSWQRLQAAAGSVGQHAKLARRAYELGELGLTETLLAHRSAIEAQLAAEQARLAANEAVARLLLDAHWLWPLGGEAEHR